MVQCLFGCYCLAQCKDQMGSRRLNWPKELLAEIKMKIKEMENNHNA